MQGSSEGAAQTSVGTHLQDSNKYGLQSYPSFRVKMSRHTDSPTSSLQHYDGTLLQCSLHTEMHLLIINLIKKYYESDENLDIDVITRIRAKVLRFLLRYYILVHEQFMRKRRAGQIRGLITDKINMPHAAELYSLLYYG